MPSRDGLWLVRRLPEREYVSSQDWRQTFYSHLPADELAEFVALFESEIGTGVGLLRPADALDRLFAPLTLTETGVLQWLFAESCLEDAASEISYRLKQRMQHRGLPLLRPAVTVDELVHWWCGYPERPRPTAELPPAAL